MSIKTQKNTEIEYLRAIAVCMVVIGHSIWLSSFIGQAITPLFRYLSMGVGVDLFFCISGYVVSRSYCNYFNGYMRRGIFWPAARAFWLRRIYRLLPSAWLWVLVGVVCSLYFNSSGVFLSFEQNLKSALAIFSFTANVAHMYEALAPNNVYWSLSLEEQFYFLFPLFLLSITSERGRIVALLLVIAIQFPLARNPFGDLTSQYLASFRIDGFAWGILLYLLSRGRLYLRFEPHFFGRYKLLSLLCTSLLIYLLMAIPAQFYALNCHMGLMAVVAAVLVWLASYGKGYIFGCSDRTGLLNWLGSRSYAIYLIHMPVFKICHELTVRYLLAVGQSYTPVVVPFLILGAIFLIVVLAELNYRCIEEPLRHRGAVLVRHQLAMLDARVAA